MAPVVDRRYRRPSRKPSPRRAGRRGRGRGSANRGVNVRRGKRPSLIALEVIRPDEADKRSIRTAETQPATRSRNILRAWGTDGHRERRLHRLASSNTPAPPRACEESRRPRPRGTAGCSAQSSIWRVSTDDAVSPVTIETRSHRCLCGWSSTERLRRVRMASSDAPPVTISRTTRRTAWRRLPPAP